MSVLALSVSWAYGQSAGEFVGPLPRAPETTSTEPVHRKGIFSAHRAKTYKVKKQKVTHSAQYEFYDRVEQAAKEHKRQLRILARPQYSNFLYYGHKHKPTIHAPEKMRYCKECGIRH
jgi:hypothetical protein